MNAAAAAFEWAWASAPLPGQSESGDHHVVVERPADLLVAVVDGLGHGSQAAEASRAAVRILNESTAEPIDELVRRCHEALRRTRGVVMSLAALDGESGRMSWLGVGNVEGVLFRTGFLQPSEALLVLGGVVGYQLPSLRARQLPIAPGDTLILTTDGIRAGFSNLARQDATPAEIARQVLQDHGRHTDDALVLVVRYVGRAP